MRFEKICAWMLVVSVRKCSGILETLEAPHRVNYEVDINTAHAQVTDLSNVVQT